MKQRAIHFGLISTVILGLVTMLVLDWLKAYMPWSLIGLLFLQYIATMWFIKGKAIFYPSFYRSYRVGQVHEITGAQHKDKDGIIRLGNHIVKTKIRKKRFEL